jgi:hypothetical protein
MAKTLFIGDSHTAGVKTLPGKYGPGSFSTWQENNYADIYAELNNKETIVYAMSGACNQVYADWLKVMLDRYPDIDEVFIQITPLNRFVLAHDNKLGAETIPLDLFTAEDVSNNVLVKHFIDNAIIDERFQLYNKPTSEDYSTFPGLDFSYDEGLKNPDIRKNTYMQIKLFFEMNTHLEQRQFFRDQYLWDRLCADKGIKLYTFNMTSRVRLPKETDLYGKLVSTKRSNVTVEDFFSKKHIDHTKYYIEDKEHYNKEYHQMIAGMFIPWLKTL